MVPPWKTHKITCIHLPPAGEEAAELSTCEYHCIHTRLAKSRLPSCNLLSWSSVGTMEKGTGVTPRGCQGGSGDKDRRQVNMQMTQPSRGPVVEQYSVGWPDPTPTQPQMDPAPASSCGQRSGVSSSPGTRPLFHQSSLYVQARQKPVSRRGLFLPICPPHPFERVNLQRTQVGSSNSGEREVVIFHIWFFQKERFLVVLGKKSRVALHTPPTRL